MITHQTPLIYTPIHMNFRSSSIPILHADTTMMTSTSFDAVDLAYRLSKLSTFLPAANELFSILSMSQNIITTKKTIRLLELARKTLEGAGIVLYSFASCPGAFVAHKKVYIDLLKMLQAKEGQENTELRGRIRILLMPLTSNFTVQKGSNSLSIPSIPLPQRHLRTTSSSSSPEEGTQGPNSFSSVAQPSTMLPPDAFPATTRPQPSLPIRDSSIESHRLPLWDHRQFEKSPTLKRRQDQENISTQSVKYRPPKKLRQFGIYCTRKSSMDSLNHLRRNERQTLVL